MAGFNTLVAGRNPASKPWPNHNPNILYVERPGRKPRDDRHETETRQPLMLADVLRRSE